MSGGGGDQVEEAHHRGLRADVRLRVAPEDLDQLVALVDQLYDSALRLELADEALLARRADDVIVVVAVTDIVQPVGAAQPLVTGGDVDLRVAPTLVVVVAVDVDVNAAELVDDLAEAAEVDVDDVVDPQAGELLDRAQRQLHAAVGVGLVQLGDAVARDLHLEVTRERQQRGGLLGGVEADKHHRVRAPWAADEVRRAHLPLVRADDEDRLRLAGV